MTLDTRFVIHDPVLKPREVFDFCRDMLGCTDRIRWEETAYGNPGLMNEPDQGLAAWLSVRWGADGPLCRDCDCEPDYVCSMCRAPVGFVEVSWDTAYTYPGFGDLHAAFVHRLGLWCEERGLGWSWCNEFTGEWHEGRVGLDELGDASRGATEVA